jgi:outer membrane receptor for ferrienterochelin and colicin
MKKILRRLIIAVFIIQSTLVQAQTTDSTTQFKVHGVCIQCKQRIEKALKIKGIKSAQWNAETKMLDVTYNPSIIPLLKIHARVAEVGHDTELATAKEDVYNALPDCCHYREMTESHDEDDEHAEEADTINHIRGIVVENRNGTNHPLAGASVQWVGTSIGARSNDHGEFVLPKTTETNKLVISYTGYKTDTVAIGDLKDIEINLSQKENLSAVIVTARKRTTFIDMKSPFRVSTITNKELLKAACCNLSESFETNPSVDVSYNDAVTGSKQIQLLGLAGNYTQLTVENLPGPRGIATPLGLNSIAGPWVESIQLIKGAGSVVNGYESIAGQINVELKKPRESERLYANGYINSMGKTDFNLNLAHKINDKWSTGLLLHDDFLYNKTDFNKDGFRDQPTGNQFSAVHRWQYLGDHGLMSQFGVKLMLDDKVGGEVAYDPAKDKGTTNHYGLGINSKRYEVFGKIGYVFPEKMYKSVGFEASAFNHQQDAYFGLRTYDAKQNNIYANLIYATQIKNEAHNLKAGLSFLYDEYNETLDATNFKRTEVVPGAFAEYTFKHKNKLDVVTGMRVDHNSLFGWFVTPRLNVRYEPINGTTIRLSAGRGQRTANIFAENMGSLVSSRQVSISGNNSSGAYGLQPEVSWNKGVSVDQKLRLFNHDASIGVDFFRNDFENQVIVDMETPGALSFYNLQGKSFSNSFQAEINFTPVDKFDVRAAYRFFDVRTTYSGMLKQKPLTAAHRAFVNLAYDLKGFKLDYTFNYTGTKRIPSTPDMVGHQLPLQSPSYITMNAQVSKALGKKGAFELYLGGENLTNFMQEEAIIGANDPFNAHFDASLIWGPINGRTIYGGFRFKIK